MKVGLIACAAIVLTILPARMPAQPSPAEGALEISPVRALRGIACEVEFRAVGSRIRATPNQCSIQACAVNGCSIERTLPTCEAEVTRKRSQSG